MLRWRGRFAVHDLFRSHKLNGELLSQDETRLDILFHRRGLTETK